MFNEKVLPWAKLIGLFASAMGTILVHTKVELRSQTSKGTYPRNDVRMNPMAFGAQREIAAAYCASPTLTAEESKLGKEK